MRARAIVAGCLLALTAGGTGARADAAYPCNFFATTFCLPIPEGTQITVSGRADFALTVISGGVGRREIVRVSEGNEPAMNAYSDRGSFIYRGRTRKVYRQYGLTDGRWGVMVGREAGAGGAGVTFLAEYSSNDATDALAVLQAVMMCDVQNERPQQQRAVSVAAGA